MKEHMNPDGSYGALVPDSATISHLAWIGYSARIGEWTWIGDGARIGERTWIGDGASIGTCATIGDLATIGERATIGDGARIGKRTRIGAWATVQTIRRTDGYWFALVPLESGDWRVTAGCRDFTPIEAREHWTRTRGGTLLGAEILAILDYFDARMALGIRGGAPA